MQFRKGGRNDLVDNKEADRTELQEFLPPPLAVEALGEIIDGVNNEVQGRGLGEMGSVVKASIPGIAGRVVGKIANAMVRERMAEIPAT